MFSVPLGIMYGADVRTYDPLRQTQANLYHELAADHGTIHSQVSKVEAFLAETSLTMSFLQVSDRVVHR